ncbi:hypothetical protein GC177_08065 [bacterium]|nr:hypothetical protein [bacterium]
MTEINTGLTGIEVFSDLHLTTLYGTGKKELERIYARLQELEDKVALGALDQGLCLINGDLPDLDEPMPGYDPVKAGLSVVRRILQDFPHLHVVYVEGNHDNHPEYIKLLHELESEFPGRLEYRKYFYHRGDILALHGQHVFGGAKKSEQLEVPALVADSDSAEIPKPNPIMAGIYGIVKMLITGIVAEKNFPKEYLINRMEYALNDVASGSGIGMERLLDMGSREVFLQSLREIPESHGVSELDRQAIERLAEEMAQLARALCNGEVHHVLAGHVHWPEPLLNIPLEVAGHPLRMHFTGAAVRDFVKGVPCVGLSMIQEDGQTRQIFSSVQPGDILAQADQHIIGDRDTSSDLDLWRALMSGESVVEGQAAVR